MLSSFLDTLLKVSKTTPPKKLFAYDCVTLYQGVYTLLSFYLSNYRYLMYWKEKSTN